VHYVEKIQITNIGFSEMTIFEMHEYYGYHTKYLKTV